MSRGSAPFSILLLITAILSLFSGDAAYADNVVLNAGIGTVLVHKADNLWTDGKGTIGSLADKPSGVTKLFPNPSFEAGYNESRSDTEYYVIVSMEDPGCLTLGAERKLPNDGSLDIYGFYSLIAREWKNPYLLNRESVHADEFGIKAACENIADSGLALSYKLTAKKIGQDDIGALNPDLRRNGVVHAATAGYRFFPYLEPGVAFERGMYEGKSNRYDYGELFLALNYRAGDFSLVARAAAGRAHFDREHPVFGKTRKENRFGIDITGKMGKPFNLPRYAVIFGTSAGKTRSNIPFFERTEQSAWVSLEYSLAGG